MYDFSLNVISGKTGVYVTLKGHKVLDAVESKLPRVTGISLPKLRKRHDAVEETVFVNQPPPTPVDVSLGSIDRNKFEALHGELIQQSHIEPIINEELNQDRHEIHDTVPSKIQTKTTDQYKEVKFADRVANIDINGQMNVEQINTKQVLDENNKSAMDSTNTEQRDQTVQNEVMEVENVVKIETKEEAKKLEPKALEKEKDKGVSQEPIGEKVIKSKQESKKELSSIDGQNVQKEGAALSEKGDKVVFFMTEDGGEKTALGIAEPGDKNNSTSESSENEEEIAVTPSSNNANVETVIRVEVSESEKKESKDLLNEPDKAITSDDFPFTDKSQTT